MVVYGVALVVTFLVVLWLTGRGRVRREIEVPRSWRLSGVMVWISLLVGGAALGLVVALVVRLGAGIALEADMGLFRWAVLFQLIALAGDLLAAGSTGVSAYAALAVIPAFGLVSLAMAFRDPPRPTPRN
jgi:hypothetical protein